MHAKIKLYRTRVKCPCVKMAYNAALCDNCLQERAHYTQRLDDGWVGAFCSKTCAVHHFEDDTDLEASEAANVKFKAGLNLSRARVTREDLGRSMWIVLHSFAAQYAVKPTDEERDDMKRFLDGFIAHYPCLICRKHFRETVLPTLPYDVSSQEALERWVHAAHNRVNQRLGKPQYAFQGADVSPST